MWIMYVVCGVESRGFIEAFIFARYINAVFYPEGARKDII